MDSLLLDPFNLDIMQTDTIQAATRSQAEHAMTQKSQYDSMRAFIVYLLSFVEGLMPMFSPCGFPSLADQPDLVAADLQYVQSAPDCPIVLQTLHSVGIYNIGVYEGQLVMKHKDAVSLLRLLHVYVHAHNSTQQHA